jgi:addiction module HigA family antidote
MSDVRIPKRKPTSVGTMLKEEFLEPMKVTQGELAKAMGVSRKTANELCGDKRGITADTAFLLAKVLGTTPGFWLNLQQVNDLWVSSHSEVLQGKLEKARVLPAAKLIAA